MLLSVIMSVERMKIMNDDLKTIEYVLSGKKYHFATIMEKYHNEIFSFVFNMLGQYQDTEDILQDIFLKVFKNLKKYNSEKASFRTWLYRIANNETINYLKSAQVRYKTTSELDTSRLVSAEDIENQAIHDEDINQVISIMKKVLSSKHQKIMMLHYFSNLTVKDIGHVMEIPEKTIYKALKSSVEKIKKEVQ